MEKKLYRSTTNKYIAGVCGGLGEYLNIDPTLVRLVFVLLFFADGIGILGYFVMWLIMPRADNLGADVSQTARSGAEEIAERARNLGTELRQNMQQPNPQIKIWIGIALVIFGGLALFRIFFPHLHWLNGDLVWPALLIVAGAALLFGTLRRNE